MGNKQGNENVPKLVRRIFIGNSDQKFTDNELNQILYTGCPEEKTEPA